MIAVIELPTPRIIKKKIKKYITGERVIIYGLVISGILIIYSSDMSFKTIPLVALAYNIVAYEILNSNKFTVINDINLLEELLKSYNFCSHNIVNY